MLQICGRIRKSEYKDDLTIIYNTSCYKDDDSLEVYEARVRTDEDKAKQNAMGLNLLDDDLRRQ